MTEKSYVTEDRCSEHVKGLSLMMSGSLEHVSDTLKSLERGQDRLAANQDKLWDALTGLDRRITHDNGDLSLQTQAKRNAMATEVNAKSIESNTRTILEVRSVLIRMAWLFLGAMATMLTVVIVKLAES